MTKAHSDALLAIGLIAMLSGFLVATQVVLHLAEAYAHLAMEPPRSRAG